MRELYIIGGGMGDPGLLTAQSVKLLESCKEVYAFDRLAEQYSRLHKNIKKCSYAELIPLLKKSEADPVGVLVSGDTGFFSAARLIKEKLGDGYHLIQTCGMNSLQYLCSKLKISYENIRVVSLHGRNQAVLGRIAYHRYVFVLTGSDHNAADILKQLTDQGLGHIRVSVGEFLSMEQERIITGTVQELSEYSFDNLSVLLFDNENPSKPDQPLFDEELTRGTTPMTKQEVRWASVNYLEPRPEDIIYDIGAGTGSVSIELARKAHDGVVYAIERDEEAYSLLNKNREKLGAFNVITKFGYAMDHLMQLPIPDKAFIGGSGKELKDILAYLFQANPGIRVVVNAISLETLNSAMTLLQEHGCRVQVACINVSRNKQIGEYNLMMASNPVYIIVGERE